MGSQRGLQALAAAAQTAAMYKLAKDRADRLAARTPAAAAPAQPALEAPKIPAIPSPNDNVGIVDRFKAGNIDQPGSEANMRWGSGKAGMDEAGAALDESNASAPAMSDADAFSHHWKNDNPAADMPAEAFSSSQV